jgi:hypothetical protein
VLEATVSPGTNSAVVRYISGQVDFAEVQTAVESTGYQGACPVEQEENKESIAQKRNKS